MASEHLEDLVSAVTIPIMVVNSQSRIAEINSEAKAIFGAGSKGRNYVAVLRQPEIVEAIESSLKSGAPNETRYSVSGHGGDRDYSVRVVPITSPIRGIVVNFLDVSHLQAEGQIRRDFVANVSHELRTPLTAMSGFIETLRGAAKNDPAAQERFLGIMAKEADRMNRLVDDLLHLSRVEAEQRVRPSESLNITDILNTAYTQLEKIAASQELVIEKDFPDEALKVIGDQDQLIQVFTNLGENAIKYGAAGGRLKVRARHLPYEPVLRSAAIQIDTIDFGEGIEDVHVPRLTERFYRVDDHRSRELGGTGLGLAIVKHIVNRHRGRLRISSQIGKGSQFSVVLPEG